jgi:hypothetical protein
MVELQLHGAIFPRDQPAPSPLTLSLSLEKIGDLWQPVAGWAIQNNKSLHSGRVTEAMIANDEARLKISMNIHSDPYVRGGRGEYVVSLRRKTGRAFAGTFTGAYKGVAVSGAAEGLIGPRQSPATVPAQPGEHPRILFRKGDLPRLKARAETDFGKASLAAMNDAIGLGLKYQITGDSSLAAQARRAVEAEMADQEGGHGPGKRAWGPRLEQVAMTYDLCYPMFNKSRVGFRAEALVFAGFSGSEASFSEKA